MRRILLTGASGFVGRHLQPVLANAFPDSALFTSRFDFADPATIEAAIRAAKPDACVHLAAIAAIPAARREPDRAWQINLHGTLALARALLLHAPDCVLLFPSSADAYGASFKCGRALDERAPLAPMNVYGATKAAADLALGAMVSDGLRVIRARPFNHTGSGQSAEFVMPAFARQIARIEAGLQAPLLRVGALDSQRDFLDVRDVCTAYAACLSHGADLPPGTILNIASGIPRRIGDILDALRCLSGVEMEIETEQARLRVGDIPSATGDATEARIRLNWAPRIDWDQTLHDVLIDWRGRVASGE